MDHNCDDCGLGIHSLAEHYMVHNDIWAEAGMGSSGPRPGTGFLCIGCLEDRLGRELRGGDFPHYHVNLSWPPDNAMSIRLLDRLNTR